MQIASSACWTASESTSASLYATTAAHAELAARPQDAQGDLAAVGDQDPGEHVRSRPAPASRARRWRGRRRGWARQLDHATSAWPYSTASPASAKVAADEPVRRRDHVLADAEAVDIAHPVAARTPARRPPLARREVPDRGRCRDGGPESEPSRGIGARPARRSTPTRRRRGGRARTGPMRGAPSTRTDARPCERAPRLRVTAPRPRAATRSAPRRGRAPAGFRSRTRQSALADLELAQAAGVEPRDQRRQQVVGQTRDRRVVGAAAAGASAGARRHDRRSALGATSRVVHLQVLPQSARRRRARRRARRAALGAPGSPGRPRSGRAGDRRGRDAAPPGAARARRVVNAPDAPVARVAASSSSSSGSASSRTRCSETAREGRAVSPGSSCAPPPARPRPRRRRRAPAGPAPSSASRRGRRAPRPGPPEDARAAFRADDRVDGVLQREHHVRGGDPERPARAALAGDDA